MSQVPFYCWHWCDYCSGVATTSTYYLHKLHLPLLQVPPSEYSSLFTPFFRFLGLHNYYFFTLYLYLLSSIVVQIRYFQWEADRSAAPTEMLRPRCHYDKCHHRVLRCWCSSSMDNGTIICIMTYFYFILFLLCPRNESPLTTTFTVSPIMAVVGCLGLNENGRFDVSGRLAVSNGFEIKKK